MNTLPRPKIYDSNAAKSRAYQDRLRAKRAVLEVLAERLLVSDEPKEAVIAQLMEELPENQKAALRSVTSSQEIETKLKKVAA